MKTFSLRRRVLAALVLVFLVGVAATFTFYRIQMRNDFRIIREAFESQPPKSAAETRRLLGPVNDEDIDFLSIVFAPVSLLGAIMIWMVLRWSLSGLSRASKEAADMRPGKHGQRLTQSGLPMELHPLVDAVNGGLERLALAYTAERRLTADCAHELRTPLAVLRLRLESGRSQPLDWPLVQRDLAHLERLVGQILDLSRKEGVGHQASEKTLINLTRVSREVSAMLQPLTQRKGRQIEVEAEDAILVRGRSGDLQDLIRNLLDNALAHGRGRILVRLQAHGGMARLSVSDEGPGIPPDQTERVFERFVKLVSNSEGAGLGLCIVRQVARDHEGDCGIGPETGEVWVSLPLGHRD